MAKIGSSSLLAVVGVDRIDINFWLLYRLWPNDCAKFHPNPVSVHFLLVVMDDCCGYEKRLSG